MDLQLIHVAAAAHASKNGNSKYLGRESVLNRRRSDKVNQIDASEVVRREPSELLIDGYNLMHVTRFKPVGSEEGELRRCREGMLALLAEQLPENQYRKVTVVFDSQKAPIRLADEFRWAHINVVFARQENSADDLIAVLIAENATPKQLVVVSSDHRVQTTAARRNATALDSDKWFDAILEMCPTMEATQAHHPNEKTEQLSQHELEAFRNEMSVPIEDHPDAHPTTDKEQVKNPFPKGYFDDIEEDF